MTIYHADALSIHDNFIAECGNCIELRGWGQASKITDNLMGAGYKGYSIYAQNFGGLLIASNNVFPRGKSSVHLKCSTFNCHRKQIPFVLSGDVGAGRKLFGKHDFIESFSTGQ